MTENVQLNGDQIADVLVIGGGPVGSSAVALLAQQGLSVVGFDLQKTVYPLPRAGSIDHEVHRLFATLGITDRVSESFLPVPTYHFVTADRRPLITAEYSSGPHPYGAAPFMFFWQPDVEQALRDVIARQPGAEFLTGHTVTGIVDDGETVTVTAHTEDGTVVTRRGRYAIGADGGASTVRRALGIHLEDFECNERWLAVDAEAVRPFDLPPALQICDPARPTGVFTMPKNFRRWLFMVKPGEDSDEVSAQWEELIAPWAKPGDVKVLRRVVYTFHGLNASRWQQGRVFLAGDAAHQTPPNLGQGLCSGIRDVTNLAWKLLAVLQGRSDESLLDSYEIERRPHMETIIGKSVELGRILCTTDPVIAADRDRRLIRERETGGGNIERDRVLPGLIGGVIDRARPGAGELFIQPIVHTATGTVALDQELGAGFALVCRAGIEPVLADDAEGIWGLLGGTVVKDQGDALGGPVQAGHVRDPHGFLPAWFTDHDADVVVVRPDRYVYAACRVDDVDEVIRSLAADVALSHTATTPPLQDHTEGART